MVSATRYTVGIDPGTYESGVAVISNTTLAPILAVKIKNDETVATLRKALAEHGITTADVAFAVEGVTSYGRPVGREVFQTCEWIGRYEEQIKTWTGRYPERVYRIEEKKCLCGTGKAKDKDIRRALIGAIGPIGTKSNPGPLYGVARDAWSAVAVAVTHIEKGRMEENHDC